MSNDRQKDYKAKAAEYKGKCREFDKRLKAEVEKTQLMER